MQPLTSPPKDALGDFYPAFSPDGSQLAFVREVTNQDVWVQPLGGGEPRQLTDSMDWSCHSPVFSDDGKALYCDYDPENTFVYNLSGIARFDWSRNKIRGDLKVITTESDRSVTGMDISKAASITTHR